MKLIEITALAVRLLGIYLLLDAIVNAGALLPLLFGGNGVEAHSPYSSMLPLLISKTLFFGAVGLVMIFFPITLSKRLVPQTSLDMPTITAAGAEFSETALCLLGIYILSWALPDLAYNLMIYNATYQTSDIFGSTVETKVSIAVTMIEIAIGLFLTLRSNGLVALISRLRGHPI